MPIKPVKYKTWLAAFVGVTVALGLTSSDAIDRSPDNNSIGSALSVAPVAGADSISPASADHAARAVATTAVVEVALLPYGP